MKEDKHYGPHLTLDLKDCNRITLDDLNSCYQFLYNLPDLIGMKRITQPHVFRYVDTADEDCGITGYVVIAESHISIHTYPNRGFAFSDVFSCRPFDIEKTKNYIIEYFESGDPIWNVVYRGKYFNV